MNEYNPAVAKLKMPDRFKSLPVDKRGYPVPRFVATVNDEPDFRVVKAGWVGECLRNDFCWLCGVKLGSNKAFVVGPMCAVNRVSSEPPSHLECARFACMACPFMVNPKRRRRDEDLPEDKVDPGGIMIERNPGVSLIWVTKSYKSFRPGAVAGAGDGILFTFGEASLTEWWARGRRATREEVLESIEFGLPLLRRVAEEEGDAAVREFNRRVKEAMRLVPA